MVFKLFCFLFCFFSDSIFSFTYIIEQWSIGTEQAKYPRAPVQSFVQLLRNMKPETHNVTVTPKCNYKTGRFLAICLWSSTFKQNKHFDCGISDLYYKSFVLVVKHLYLKKFRKRDVWFCKFCDLGFQNRNLWLKHELSLFFSSFRRWLEQLGCWL